MFRVDTLRDRTKAIARALYSPPARAGDSLADPALSPHARTAGLALVICTLTAVAAYAARIEIGFSADGAHYFAQILDSPGFFHTRAWSRFYSQIVMQWPLVMALAAGVESLPVLKSLFHFSLYFPFLLSFALCCYAVRPLNYPVLLLFPLASYVLVSLPAMGIWVGEGQFLAVVVWPILFFLLHPRLKLRDGLVLIALLWLMSRSKETAAASASIFILLLVLRLWVDRSVPRWMMLLAASAAGLSVAIGAYWTLFPASARNRASFARGAVAPLDDPMFLIALGSMGLLFASVYFVRFRSLGVLAVPLAGASLLLPGFGHVMDAGVSFSSRTLTLTLLPILICLAVLFHAKRPNVSTRIWILACAAVSLLGVGHAMSWTSWGEFRHRFMATLEANSGYVAVEDTPIAESRQRWAWTTPLLSVLWARECVGTVVLNAQKNLRWEPFSPYETLPLQNYILFSETFEAATPNAEHCKARAGPV